MYKCHVTIRTKASSVLRFLYHTHTVGPLWPSDQPVAKAATYTGKGKAIPLQASTGPEGSRRLRFPDFKTIGT